MKRQNPLQKATRRIETQKWAESVAEMMEEKWKNEQRTVKRGK